MSGYRTMKRIWIIGDSFSTNMSSKSWTNLLSDNAEIINLSKNGISLITVFMFEALTGIKALAALKSKNSF